MNQSNDELNQFSALVLKCLSRTLLLILISVMSYVVTRSAYNFSHWIPHRLLHTLGIDYSTRLWAEQNADVFLHFFGAMSLTWLIYCAKLGKWLSRPLTISAMVAFLCVCAEIFQFLIGRGLESSDLLLGFLGTFVAYSTINKKD